MAQEKPSADDQELPRVQRLPLIGLLVLIGVGVVLHALGLFDWHETLQWAKGHAQHGWLVVVLIAAQVVLFMFALPGSTLLWVVAPLYPPLYASAILALGGSLGGLAAYFVAQRATARQLVLLRDNRWFRYLERHSDFLALLAVRLFPAFPHSVVNYGAGVLRLPIGSFFFAAFLGLGVKSFLYASVIHSVVEAEPSEFFSLETLLALIGLVALVLVGRAFGRRL